MIALEHHEKLDGSGYPGNKTKISMPARIIGIIDCDEALTSDDHPYRNAMQPFDSLSQIIGKDASEGKFNKKFYAHFVKSLGSLR